MLSVLDKGAVGDGVYDDRAAIQAAIDDVAARGGGTVLFPRGEKGQYKIGSRLQIKNHNVRLLGEAGARIQLADAANTALLVIAKTEQPALADVIEDCAVENLELYGNYATQTRGATGFELEYGNPLILAVGTRRLTVRGCYLYDAINHGIAVLRSLEAKVIDNTIKDVGRATGTLGPRNGISLHGKYPGSDATVADAGEHVVSGNTVTGSFNDLGIGVHVYNEGCVIVGNTVQGANMSSLPQYGILFETQSADAVAGGRIVIAGNTVRRIRTGIGTLEQGGVSNRGVTIVGNGVYDAVGTAYAVEGGSFHAIVGNVAERYGTDGSLADAHGIAYLPGHTTRTHDNLLIADNNIVATVPAAASATNRAGIIVAPANGETLVGCVIKGNVVQGPGTLNSEDRSAGIYVLNTVSRLVVEGNYVAKFENGISTSSNRAVLSGNYLVANNSCGLYFRAITQAPVADGNYCLNNGQRGAATVRAGIAGQAVDGSFAGNACVDDQATATQQYGFHFDNGAGSNSITGGRLAGNATAPILNFPNYTHFAVRGVRGVNPVGKAATQPAVPSSGTNLTNPMATDATVYITGGVVTEVRINGQLTGLISGAFRVGAGQYVTLTYTAAPTWVWFGD